MMFPPRIIRCLTAMLVVAACTSPHSSTPAAQSAVIGASGGSVSESDGSSVTIPAGALPANTTVTVTPTSNPPTPPGASVVGQAYTLGPEGQKFSQPVTVTLTFDPSLLPAGKAAKDIVIYTAPVGSMNFTSLGGTLVDATHVKAETTHFSVFMPGVGGSSSGSCAVCASGLCASACPAGTTACGSDCIDTQHDSQNCGACGNVCPAGTACGQGVCVAQCGAHSEAGCASGGSPDGGVSCCPGFSMCGGQCVDLQSSSQNCGACGSACGQGESCEAGKCTSMCPQGALCYEGLCVPSCPAGTQLCGGACVDTQHDASNCGACGTSCAAGEGCAAGTCVPTCGLKMESGCGSSSPGGGPMCCQGFTQCGSTCADLQNDSQNCGACGTACSAGQTCRNGACGPLCDHGATCYDGLCVQACPSGTAMCNGACVDTQSDSANCGACGQSCASGQGCLEGACTSTCGPMRGSDGGTIVSDDGGSSGNSGPDAGFPSGKCQTDADCPTGLLCVNGMCGGGGASDSGGPTCSPNAAICNGVCTDIAGDPQNCGGCNQACQPGQACMAGACVGSASADGGMVCVGGEVECGGVCANLATDPQNCGACMKACPAGAFCANGVCQTKPGTPCASDADCSSGLACVNGMCQPPMSSDGGATGCPQGEVMCGAQCTNPMSDPNNCGKCGIVCAPGEKCFNGSCGTPPAGPCSTTADCASGLACVNGMCQPPSNDGGMAACPAGEVMCPTGCTNVVIDTKNCGGCGLACPAGQTCSAGACQ